MNSFNGSPLMKYTGIVLTVLGIPLILMDHSNGAAVPLLFGLFFIFISRVDKEDERSGNLRFRALTMAFVTVFLVSHVLQYTFQRGWLSWRITEIDHFCIAVMAIALVSFYVKLYRVKA